jgi:DNA invertase Pin-like site-specific DNA recombinase
MTSTDGTVAREYLRVSKDKSGRERSIVEQHADNEADAADHGWTLGQPYSDVGSASRYATKPRGNYDTLVSDLRADRFGADVLILWESSRGSRRASEWLALIELCAERGVKIHVTSHQRTYDPTIGRDRKSLRDDASDSEYESDKISQRATRANGANAKAGRPHGRVPYGFRRTYDPTTGDLVGQEIEPDEAKVIRELFDRIAAGHSLRGIARDFAARNITKRSGGPFSPAHLRSLATTHAYAGIRVHVPGRRDGNKQRRPDMIEYKADWPAIVPRRTWLAVQQILSDPGRKTTRPGRGRHLLSMIAKCDVCGGPLAATERDRGPEYQCHRGGHVRIDKPGLDDLAERAILAYLGDPARADRITRRDADDAELEAAKVAVAEVEAELRDLVDRVSRGALSLDFAQRVEPGIRQRLDAAKARVTELETPAPLAGYITPGRDVARRWKAAPMSARREVARVLLTPAYLGELRVTRSPSPGHRAPVKDRTVWLSE